MFYNGAKKDAIQRLKKVESEYNNVAVIGNDLALELYEERKSAVKAIIRVEKYINSLANTPKEFKKDISVVMESLKEFSEAMKIEKENISDNVKGASAAAGGTVVGGAIAALGPTAAMAIATTFGTASTGAAIASLSGAAATNAALAWLGGGALAAGGGGMAAGNALLALAGPIGWGIAGLALIGGGAFTSHKNKKAAEEADALAAQVRNKLAVLRPMIEKLQYLKAQTKELKESLGLAKFTLCPSDYEFFSSEQKSDLAVLINNCRSLGVLINERVA